MSEVREGDVTRTRIAAKRTRPAKAAVIVESSSRPAKPFLKQGTTWAGIFSIAAAIATGGVSVLTDPYMIAQIGAGIGLLIAEN